MTKETNLQIVLQDTLALLDTKEEIIRNLTKKVAELTEQAQVYVLMCEEELCVYPVCVYKSLSQAQKEAEKRNNNATDEYERYYIVQNDFIREEL